MSNAKRAIMVPVMTLAVCAIAMVGLGFSLSSSVTSENNAVEDLMIDMSDELSYFTGNGEAVNHPGGDNVNELLGITLTNKKTNTTPGIEMTGGAAYMKIYGNIASGITLNVKATSDTDSAPTTLTITIYELSNDTLTAVGTVKYGGEGNHTLGEEVTFTKTNTSGETTTTTDTSIDCGKVYVVAITEINGWTFNYTSNGTLSGTVSTSTNVFDKSTSLKYVFTVTNDSSTSAGENSTQTGQTGETQN